MDVIVVLGILYEKIVLFVVRIASPSNYFRFLKRVFLLGVNEIEGNHFIEFAFLEFFGVCPIQSDVEPPELLIVALFLD